MLENLWKRCFIRHIFSKGRHLPYHIQTKRHFCLHHIYRSHPIQPQEHTTLDDAPNTPVNHQNLTTSSSSNNPEILRPQKTDSFIDYPTTLTSLINIAKIAFTIIILDHFIYIYITRPPEAGGSDPGQGWVARRPCGTCSIRTDSDRCIYIL